MTLLEHLATVPDPRRPQGRRYPLPQMLTMTIMAMMSGHHGYRPAERFIHDNADDLRRLLDWPREAMPSNVTLRAVLQAIDFGALSAVFRAWAAERLPEGEVLALDAKAVRSTCIEHDTEDQDFVALVSAYGVHSGIVASATAYQNGQTSEIDAAKTLIADLALALDLKGVTVTLDALHCTKKRSAASRRPVATGSSSSRATAAGCTPNARRTSTSASR